MRKLSRPLSQLKPEYDVIVIGSGYGGSISASRFSRAGLKVCLLERGKEFQPGDYPSTLVEAAKEMQLDTDNREGVSNGLYNFHVSEDITVFKGCGLGGTSLVNANVAIIPEERVFENSAWPAAIRNDKKSLEDGYTEAGKILNPKPYPENSPGYPELLKVKAMKKSAEDMKQPCYLANINVTFTDGPNSVGYPQKKCINCGDCVTGCNHDAKNTLIMNYLPDAVNRGAEIFCNIDVRYVERSGDGWLVYFDVFHTDRGKFHAPNMFVRAKTVIVSGGALGSTEILFRSKEKGLKVSPMLGKHFTGNGDMLGFAYNCDQEIKGMGLGNLCDNPELGPVGPCIVSIMDMRKQPVLEDGFSFEEGSIPGPLVSVVNAAMLAESGIAGVDTDSGFNDKVKEMGRKLTSLLKGPYHGAANSMQTYLIMSHDDGKGEMNLKNDRLNIDWKGVGKQTVFQKASDAMYNATKALGGTYIKNVLWNKALNYDVVTVHPLGGCCMGDNATTGVTDHTGNVFTGENNGTHPGLYVLDGSVLPAPLGTNPLFTISAVTERACKIIVQNMGLQAKEDKPEMNLPDVAEFPVVQFTETMKGYFSKNEKEDFQKGYAAGKVETSPFLFTLTIQTGNISTFDNDPEHPGTMAGTVVAPALSDRPLTVSNGIFNLFVKDPVNPDQLKMKYRMQLNAHDGRSFYFYGYKQVQDDKGFDLWSDTSTLMITVHEGKDETGAVVGKGMLKIAPTDFAIQMTTMKAVGTKTKLEGLQALAKFSMFFSKNIINTYFAKLF